MADVVTRAIYELQVKTDADKADAAIAALTQTQNEATASTAKMASAQNDLAKSTVSLTLVEEKETKAKRTTTDELSRWLGSLDKSTKATQQYQAGLERLARFEREQIGTATERAQVEALLTERYNQQTASLGKLTTAANENAKIAVVHSNALKGVGNAAKLSYVDMEILRSGVVNVAQSLAAGQAAAGVFQVQLFQIAPAIPGLVRSLGSAGLAIGGIGLAIAATVGGFLLLVNRLQETQARLRSFDATTQAFGTGANTTALGLESIAKSLRDTGTAAADAQKAILAVARIPGINAGAAAVLSPLARDIASVSGDDFIQTQTRMATAFATSTDAAIKFVQSVAGPNGLTVAEMTNMQTMSAHGDRAGALKIAIDALQKQFGGKFIEQMSDSGKAINSIGAAWDNMLTKLSETRAVGAARDAIIGMLNGIAGAATGAATAVASIPEAPTAGNVAVPSIGTGGATIPGAGAALANRQAAGLSAPNLSVGGALSSISRGANFNGLNSTVAQRVQTWLGMLTPAELATLSIGPRSAVRTVQQSADIQAGGGIAASPGGSAHNLPYGIAVDIQGMSKSAADKLALAGLHQPVPGDSMHVEPIETLSAATSTAAARQQSFAEFNRLHPGSLGAPTTGGVGTSQFGSGIFTMPAVLPLPNAQPSVLAEGTPVLTEEQKKDMQDTVKFNDLIRAHAGDTGPMQTWWAAYLSNLGKGKEENKDIWVAMEAANQAVAMQGAENTKTAVTQKITNDLGLQTATAYGTDLVSGYQAAAKAQAELAVRNGTANDVASKTAEILQTQAVAAIASGAEQIASARKEEEAQGRLVEAAKQGTGALHDQQVANEGIARTQDAYNKALATGNPELIARAKALQDVSVEEAKRLDTLKTSAEIQTKILGNKDNIEVLQLEASLAGQSADEINRQVTLLQTKQALDAKGSSVTKEQRDALMQSTDEMLKQASATADQQRAAQRLNDVLTNVGQTIDQDITQNIENALSGQKITSWHTIFKNVLVQLESQLISLSIIKPAIGSVLGFLGFGQAAQGFGTLTGAGGILSGGAGLLGNVFGSGSSSSATGGPVTLEQRDKEGNLTGTLSTVSSVGSLANTGSGLFGGGGSGGLFGSGGISGFVNNTIGTSLGFAPSGLLPGSGAGAGIFTNAATGATSDIAGSGVAGGLFGGTTLGGFLGGVGAGATVGSLANMFIGPMIGGGKSTGGMIGSTGGALAGAIIGSIVPGIGTLLGGIIGGAGGGLLGGFFGPKPANNAGSGSLNLATGQLGAFTSGGVAANDQAAQGILQPISTTLANITQILGASVLPQATLIAQAGSRDGIKVNIASGEGVKSFTGSDAGAVVQEVAKFLYEHRDLSALSPTLQKAVGSLDINQIQDTTQLTTAVNFSKIYDTIVTAADSAFQSIESGAQQAGPFEQAMSQITDTFAQLTTQAQQYGLSIDPINAALAEATKRINVDFAKAVDAAYNTATGNDFLNGVQSLVDNYASMAREASAIGASTTVFDKLGQTFDASLKTMFAQLNSTQLNAVIAAFGDLGNDLPALAASARDAALASEALIAAQNQQAQIYQNQQDSYTAANQGFLAQLRDLDKARIATQATNKSLGLGSDQDAQVQETEHRAALNILMALTNDQMESARSVLAQLNPAFAAWVDEAEAAVKATNDGADASARAAQVLQAQASIQAYLNQLQTQSSVFTSGKSRLDAAQSQYNTMLAAAQGGDVTALQGITTAAQTLLQNVSDYYASSAPGQAIFKQVQDQLTALLGTGLTTAPDKTTTDVVNAITDDTTTTTTTSNNNTISLITAGIDTAKQITDNAISTSAGVIAAANTANDNLVNSTITTGAGITQATLDGAASIVGGTAQQFTAQTVTLMTGTGTVVEAATATTAAVVSSGTDIVTSTVALLDNNVTNAANLIASNSTNAVATINANTTNATALQAAGAAQTSAIIDGNTSNANTLVTQAAANTNTLIATNDNHTAILTATAQATTDRSVATAVANTQAMAANADINTQYVLATIAAWSGAIINSQVAWDNAINGTIAGWLSAVVSATGGGQGGVIQAVFAAADSIVGTVAGWSNAVVGSVWGAASAIIANEAGFANSIVGAVYGAANGIIATDAAYENSTRASVDSANNNIANWLNGVNQTIVWSINNVNDRSNEHLNKLQEILNNMIGWNRNLWDQLNVIREYMQLLTEVTINFNEFMAGSQGANTDIMNQIQNTLRRQAFG